MESKILKEVKYKTVLDPYIKLTDFHNSDKSSVRDLRDKCFIMLMIDTPIDILNKTTNEYLKERDEVKEKWEKANKDERKIIMDDYSKNGKRVIYSMMLPIALIDDDIDEIQRVVNEFEQRCKKENVEIPILKKIKVTQPLYVTPNTIPDNMIVIDSEARKIKFLSKKREAEREERNIKRQAKLLEEEKKQMEKEKSIYEIYDDLKKYIDSGKARLDAVKHTINDITDDVKSKEKMLEKMVQKNKELEDYAKKED